VRVFFREQWKTQQTRGSDVELQAKLLLIELLSRL
jgi:hypothetical protein